MDRVFMGVLAAAGLYGAGFTVIAQGVFAPTADTVERIIGGTVLFAGATFLFRWTYKFLAALRQDNQDLRGQLNEMTTKYEEERKLRMSLEEAGFNDRRHKPPPEGTPQGF